MIITAITQQKKDKNRFNIFIDGQYSFALDTDTLLSLKLHKNQTLTEADLYQFRKYSDLSKWVNKVLLLISRRPRSCKEVRDYLFRHKVDELTQKAVIEKLEARKFLNDEEFSRWFVEQRKAFKPKGRRLLAQELTQRGIAAETIEVVLSGQINEMEEASQIARKKLARLGRYDLQIQKKKLIGFLQTRGYGWNIISSVLKVILTN